MKAVTVVIETPRHCIGKYFFDEESRSFRLKKILPLGMSFPYDFGMIKNTRAQDGDPVDAVVISECDSFPGVEMECRVIGALLAEQTAAGQKKIRNDRYIFIPEASLVFEHIKDISDFSKKHNQQLEEFFINYNKVHDKKFTPLRWIDSARAEKLLKKIMN
jgi:inorganic pyrophosphatase